MRFVRCEGGYGIVLMPRAAIRRSFFCPNAGPMTRQAFNYICAEIGKRAKLTIKVHPHVLRHSTGYALANKGRDTRLIQDFLGHRNIQHTQIYTRTAAIRFERLWS